MTPGDQDLALEQVKAAILRLDPDGSRMATIFRYTFDQLYDGRRTGRYKLDQLLKTEKTHFGSLIEINLQREFNFADGFKLDFQIEGHDIDCKYSHTKQWMIPKEAHGELLMVCSANDQESTWDMGLVRASPENLRGSFNRDQKTSLSREGKTQIDWLFSSAPMPPNVLLQLDPADVGRIMSQPSGQKRVNELLRTAQNMRITRNIIETVAQQMDSMKRLRRNGGARTILEKEDIFIFSGDYLDQVHNAERLGATVPHPGEIVSVSVVPSTPQEGVEISGRFVALSPHLVDQE